MIILTCALLSIVDTISLPQPATAITIADNSQLAFINSRGDELFIADTTNSWQNFSLAKRFISTRRILLRHNLLYLLESGNLIVCNLRTAETSTVAIDVDDAVLNQYGEIWVISDNRQKKLSPLGRELGSSQPLTNQYNLWYYKDSLLLKPPNSKPPIPPWLETFFKINSDNSQVTRLQNLILHSSPTSYAIDDNVIYILINPKQVILLKDSQ